MPVQKDEKLREGVECLFIEIALYFMRRNSNHSKEKAIFVLPDASEEYWEKVKEFAPQWGVSVEKVWKFKRLVKVTVTDFSKLNFTNLTFD